MSETSILRIAEALEGVLKIETEYVAVIKDNLEVARQNLELSREFYLLQIQAMQPRRTESNG